MRANIISGVVGALAIILIGIVIFAIYSPIDVAPVYMINSTQLTDTIQYQQLDSLRCMHLEVLRDLENKGLLLSPSDYTSHVTSYYNGLIAFLIGIFAFFTLGGIVAVRFTSKREIEEFKQEIRSETRNHILSQLSSMMNDSKSFQETTLSALTGRFEDRIVTHEHLESMEDSLDEIRKTLMKQKESIDLLYECFNEYEDLKAANENISEE